jgi:hypothetical protein
MTKLKHIFSIVPDCHVQTGHYADLWRRHFYNGLKKVTEKLFVPAGLDFAWARAADAERRFDIRSQTSEKLWRQIKETHSRHGLDAVISYCFGSDVDVELVGQTIRLGVPWTNFFCDSTHRFQHVESLAKAVSLNWFPETTAAPRYRALGVPFLCQPYALNDDELPDLSCTSPQRLLGFVGFPSANRITQLGVLRLWGYRTDIRGPGWTGNGTNPFRSREPLFKRLVRTFSGRSPGEKLARRFFWLLVRHQTGGELSANEFVEFVRECQVVLGLNQGRDEHGRLHSYLKFRDLEFPGYGCCYLTEQNPDISVHFEVGREILTYKTLREAAGQVRRICQRPELARQVGQSGRRRVLAEHTWQTRIRQLAEAL